MDGHLRGLQLIQLRILNDVDKICRRHNIKYYLYGGTLLGAIRHKGFIPWDDDVDIAMMRSDYERFADICTRELPKSLFFQTAWNDPEYHLLFTKIRDDSTTFIEHKGSKCHQGIAIDVFALDNVPATTIGRLVQKTILNLIRIGYRKRILKNLYTQESFLKNLFINTVFILTYFIPSSVLRCLYEFLSMAWNRKNTGYVAAMGMVIAYDTEIMRKEVFKECIELEFEGLRFMAPSGWHEYLEKTYGDYMTLPPVEKRYNHDPKIVDLDNRYDMYL